MLIYLNIQTPIDTQKYAIACMYEYMYVCAYFYEEIYERIKTSFSINSRIPSL